MTFTTEQKTLLAKLMATENLTVQHQKIRTARFDPINRVLYLPVWQDMTGALYDLLCGHEVGHALYTPAEGWHDAVVDKTKGKNFKSFLNVVEDARIEKKVKRKYPGLKASFQAAYAELMKRDFFGINGRDINSMAFINRLNIYTKSQYTATYIEFSTEEKALVEKVMAMETWNDVLSVTNEVYEYSKNEQFDMQDMNDFAYKFDENGEYEFEMDSSNDEFSDEPFDSEMSDDGETSDVDDDAEREDGESDDKSEKSEKSEDIDDAEETDAKKDVKSDADKDAEETDEEQSEESNKINRLKDSTESTGSDQFAPECETDDAFRNNEMMLLDEKCKDYVYVTLPKPIYKNIITGHKRVHEILNEYYDLEMKEYRLNPEKAKSWVNDFKVKNDRYVSLLAKEFEMRKAAKAFSKSKLSDTGDIDINKLSSYQFDDNIFRKVMLTPKGKSHGLVLLLDRSGSMSDNMAGSLEQIMVLAMFCRKVNIPFLVYGFGDCTDAHAEDNKINRYNNRTNDYPCFDTKDGDLSFSNMFLREYLSSKMNNREFSNAIRNMVLLMKSYEGGRYVRHVGRPATEHLSNTPMIQAIVAVSGIMKEFRKRNNLDLSSLVIVHDGDADSVNRYQQTTMRHDNLTGQMKPVSNRMGFDPRWVNAIVIDKNAKFSKRIDHENEGMTEVVLDWFRKSCDSKVFGFFLASTQSRGLKNALYWRYVFEDGTTFQDMRAKGQNFEMYEKQNELAKKFRTEKYLVSNKPGYNSFYLIAGGSDLNTNDEEIEVTGKVTAGKLKNAFMKYNKKRAVNRVLVSKFIQGIAA
jgi:hypothetical protein